MTFDNEPIVWRPSAEIISSSRLGQFLQAHQLKDLAELRVRAAKDPAWFWDAVVKMLDWPFETRYHTVLDTSEGLPWARWFVGGTSNVAWAALDRHVQEGYGHRLAVIQETEAGAVATWTYAELKEQVDRMAHALTARGIEAGDRIALYLPMGVEAVIAMLAAAKMAAVIVPVFSGYGASAVATRLKDSGAKAMITADGFTRRGRLIAMKEEADQALREQEMVRLQVVVRRLGIAVHIEDGRDWDWDALMREGSNAPYPTAIVPTHTPLMVIYTSGTTGAPKGAVHTHLGFPLKATQDLWHAFDLRRNDVLFWYTDMGWMMGPWMVYGGLVTGCTLVLYDGTPDFPDAARLWQMIERHQVSVFGISPTAIRGLMVHGDEPPMRYALSSLRVLGSSGEPWNPDPWRWFFDKVGKTRCPIINYSGGTEISGGILSAFVSEPQKACAFNGPIPGMVADVVDENGQPVRHEVGELVLKAPWPGMTQGFWNNRDRYLDTYWNRWPNTWVHGDFAYVDAEGFWYILGRSDDTIKVAGKRLGPAEVESVLVSHPDVAEAAAIGVPDAVKGESLVCFVVIRPHRAIVAESTEQLKQYVAAHLGKALKPQALYIVSELPKTRNGKVVRRAIKASYLGLPAGDLSAVENIRALDAVRSVHKN
ncbi:MAG: AMP-dependent synthetase [Sulfobacillus acidophilus]|uniref:acetate--CoA ligase n=1 Tax=Sulfobacillus acidophilus TaxID=53633 RepID=A0A2T2WJ00_9FIRM|nr:MAG: AMP-dependent synthetase [Sulfobacillus acidophilus]